MEKRNRLEGLEVEEYQRKVRTCKCHCCGQIGHKKRTCPARDQENAVPLHTLTHLANNHLVIIHMYVCNNYASMCVIDAELYMALEDGFVLSKRSKGSVLELSHLFQSILLDPVFNT